MFINYTSMNIYIHIELTADKMQNLLTKQEPEGAYSTDLHELQKNCHLNYHMTGANRKTTFSK